jgi:hypothetical protein
VPTGAVAGGEQPTRILGEGGGVEARSGWEGQSNTSPLAGSNTDPVAPPRQTAYASSSFQTPPASNVAAPSPQPARKKGRSWLFAFLIIGLAGAFMLVGLLYAISSASKSPRVVVRKLPKNKTGVPAPPPPRVERAAKAETFEEGGETTVSGDRSVFKKTYELSERASVTLENAGGKISVETWDEPGAEVTITRRGGTAEERESVAVVGEHKGDRLTLKSSATGGANDRSVEVEYEVKLPRALRQLEIRSERAELELSGLKAAAVAVDVREGEIELEEMGGEVSTKIIKGSTRIVLGGGDEATQGSRAPNSFSVVRGDVELEIAEGANLDLKAEVLEGEIEVEDELGLKLERRAAAQYVAGRIGAGGKPVVIRVTNGNIRIKR